MSSGGRVEALELPSVDDPGILDRRKLEQLCHDWMVECRPGISSRLAGGLRSMSGSFDITDAASVSRPPGEPVTAAIGKSGGTGRLLVPETLASQMVASALGYSRSTDTPLTGADLELLEVPVKHLLASLDRALQRSETLRLTQLSREPIERVAGTVVVLSVALDVRGAADVIEVVLPWDGLREAIRSRKKLQDAEGISLDKLQRLPLVAEAVIGDVTMPVRAGSELEIGDVVVLGDRPDKPVRLMIGDVQVVTGKLGSHENSWAVRVTDVAWQSQTDAGGSGTDESGSA